MLSLFAVYNCSNRADREIDNSNYQFFLIVKNNDKGRLKLPEVRREEVVCSNFQERCNWEKAREELIQRFLPPPYQFLYTKFELGQPVSESSTKIWKLYDPTDTEHKFNKTRIKTWLSIGFELESPWLGTYSHNIYTMFNLQYDEEP